MSQIEKRSVGRPTDYDSKYCEMLIEHMSSGLSFEAFGGVIGVCKKTLYTWCEKQEEFLYAKQIATAKCRLWWEKVGTEGLWSTSEKGQGYASSRSFNTGVWVFNMKNRFKEEWRERHDTDDDKSANDTAPKVIVYLPKNGREAPDQEKTKKDKKK